MSPSPEMKAALQAIQDARKIIDQLKRVAIQRRDPAATQALVEVASVATLAVRALWFDRSFEFDPDDAARALAARREWLSYQFSSGPFPVLHYWDEPNNLELNRLLKSRPECRAQETMLEGIRSWPFKGRKRTETEMKTLIEAMILPQFQRIQFEHQRPIGTKGRIWNLPPLTQASAKQWGGVIVDWLWARHRSKIENPNSWLYMLARPELERDRELNKESERLESFRKTHLNIRIGGLEPDHQKHYNARRETLKAKTRAAKIEPRHIVNGLKTEIRAYLRRNLQKLSQ